MAEEEASFQPKAVKDVPAEQFISAYAAHLKTNDKVRSQRSGSLLLQPGSEWQRTRPWRRAEGARRHMTASAYRHCWELASRLLLLKAPAGVQQPVQHLRNITTI